MGEEKKTLWAASGDLNSTEANYEEANIDRSRREQAFSSLGCGEPGCSFAPERTRSDVGCDCFLRMSDEYRDRYRSALKLLHEWVRWGGF